MAAQIRGITITLMDKVQTGTDALGDPVWEESPVTIDNVLVAPASSQEVLDIQTLTGKKAVYNLAIPKGDAHTWEDRNVVLPAPFAGTYHTIAYVQAGIEELVPLDWNRKISVERYG